jgi:aromatic ring hydroxylase
MISGNQYKERMAKLKPNIYQGGKLVDRFDPSILGGINVISATYDFAADPEYNGVASPRPISQGKRSTASPISIRIWRIC